MALTLNEIGQTKPKKSKKKSTSVKSKASSDTQEEIAQKVRPWQTAEEIEVIEKKKTKKSQNKQKSEKVQISIAGYTLPSEVVRVLHRVEDLKNGYLAQLPPEVAQYLENSWVSKLQVYPKIRVPMPQFLVRKERK